ncbi:MAG TPA: hypothetical protein VGA73_11230 [Candidatus Binatia bacterium]
MGKIFLSSIILFFLFVGVGSFAQENRAEAPAYKGNESWTYRAVDKLYDGSSSDLLNGDYEVVFQNGKLEVRYVDGSKKVQAYRPGILNLMVPTTATLESPEPPFRFPLWVGQKSDITYLSERNYLSDRRRSLTAHDVVTDVEMVQTPAGSFRAFKIERRVQFISGVGNRVEWNLIYDFFYSPDIGSVVKLAFKIEKVFNFGDRTLERATDIELTDWSPR